MMYIALCADICCVWQCFVLCFVSGVKNAVLSRHPVIQCYILYEAPFALKSPRLEWCLGLVANYHSMPHAMCYSEEPYFNEHLFAFIEEPSYFISHVYSQLHEHSQM